MQEDKLNLIHSCLEQQASYVGNYYVMPLPVFWLAFEIVITAEFHQLFDNSNTYNSVGMNVAAAFSFNNQLSNLNPAPHSK
jgi:hypothetical protein